MRFSNEWTLAVRNLLLPIFCKHCGDRILTDENGYFCPTCWEMSPRIERPFCPVCGRPHPPGVGLGTRSNFRCGPCSSGKQDPPYRRILGAAIYVDVIEEAIKLFKFNDKPRLAGPIGELMAEVAARELDCETYTHLIPVPLYKVRLRERGYNQSLLLAKEVLPSIPNASLDESLRRIRPTRVQSTLHSEAERRENVRGAFAVETGAQLTGAAILLVDDVVTTGGTITECAQVLRSAGASTVDILAAALAMPHAFHAQSG